MRKIRLYSIFYIENKSNALKTIERLVTLGKNSLGHEHIYVVTQDEVVIGILLYSLGVIII